MIIHHGWLEKADIQWEEESEMETTIQKYQVQVHMNQMIIKVSEER